ncbi:MAG: Mov34/MPN/PAD-1 family protein [Candidatus Diapherotrites archaeon]|uniref:Mov34/MPN/PAD-1 family protein n=1 Tax=Candidatus Iainarchaeum sp. TaxID=3101447 RepID=A0A8T3YJU3_9ARCH|nr:Mov34/MPN/PAD-1 family protein [Candidatus Diapherotrites archaeon]
MHRIKRQVLESIIMAAKNVYPLEFFSMLGGRNKVIEELVVVPATYGESFSSYRLDLVPFDSSIIGTVHSHPSEENYPSDADLESFSKFGEVHLIIGHPYNFNTVRAFDNKGRHVTLRVVDD